MNTRYMTVGFAILAIACAGSEQQADDTAAAVATATTPTRSGMEGMAGMQGMPMAGGMNTDQMRAHMTAMQGAGGDSLMRMSQMHRQMAANMIAQFNREMSRMDMPEDPQWRATVDSVRQDLVRMPELTVAEMEQMMPAHHARMVRLMEMHRAMMSR